MAQLINFPSSPTSASGAKNDPLQPPEGASDADKLTFTVVRSLAQIAGELNNEGHIVHFSADPAQTFATKDHGVQLKTTARLGIGGNDFASTAILIIETKRDFWNSDDASGPGLTVIAPMRYGTGDMRVFRISDPQLPTTWTDELSGLERAHFQEYIRDVVHAVSGLPDPNKVSTFAGFELTPRFHAPSRPSLDADVILLHTPKGPGSSSS